MKNFANSLPTQQESSMESHKKSARNSTRGGVGDSVVMRSKGAGNQKFQHVVSGEGMSTEWLNTLESTALAARSCSSLLDSKNEHSFNKPHRKSLSRLFCFGKNAKKKKCKSTDFIRHRSLERQSDTFQQSGNPAAAALLSQSRRSSKSRFLKDQSGIFQEYVNTNQSSEALLKHTSLPQTTLENKNTSVSCQNVPSFDISAEEAQAKKILSNKLSTYANRTSLSGWGDSGVVEQSTDIGTSLEDSLHERAKHEIKDGLEKRYQKYYEKYGVKELIKTGFDEQRKHPENSQYTLHDAYSIKNKENINDQNVLKCSPTQHSSSDTDTIKRYSYLKNDSKDPPKNKIIDSDEKEKFYKNRIPQKQKEKSLTETKHNNQNKRQHLNTNNDTQMKHPYKEQYNKVYKLESTFADNSQGYATKKVEVLNDFEKTCQNDWVSLQNPPNTLYDNVESEVGYDDSIPVTDSLFPANNDTNNIHSSYVGAEYQSNSHNFPYIDTVSHALTNKEMETIFEEASMCSVGSNSGAVFNSGIRQAEQNEQHGNKKETTPGCDEDDVNYSFSEEVENLKKLEKDNLGKLEFCGGGLTLDLTDNFTPFNSDMPSSSGVTGIKANEKFTADKEDEKSYIIEKMKSNEGKTYHWRTSAIYKSRRSQNSDVLFENVTYKNGKPRKGLMKKCFLTVIWSFVKTEIKEETITFIRVARLMLDYEMTSLPNKKETKPMIHERKVTEGEVKWLEEKEDSSEEINENNNNNTKSNKRTSIVSSTTTTPPNFEDTGLIMDAVKEVCDVIANTKTMVNEEFEPHDGTSKNESFKSKKMSTSEDSNIGYTGTNYKNASNSVFEKENVTLLPDIITTTQSPHINQQQNSFNNLKNNLMTTKFETDFEIDDVMEYKMQNEKEKLSSFPISTTISNASKNTVHFMCGSFGQDRSIKELHVASGTNQNVFDEDIYTSDSSFKSFFKESLPSQHKSAQKDSPLNFSTQIKPEIPNRKTDSAFEEVNSDGGVMDRVKSICIENNKVSSNNVTNTPVSSINASTDISMEEEWMDCKDWDERVQPFATSSPKFEDYYDDYNHLPHNMKFERSHETKPQDTWYFNSRKEKEEKTILHQASYKAKPLKSSPSSSSYYSPHQSPHLPQNNSQYHSHQISSSSIASDYHTPNLVPSPKLSSSPSAQYETCLSEDSDKNNDSVDKEDTLKNTQQTFGDGSNIERVDKMNDDTNYDSEDTCVCHKGFVEDDKKLDKGEKVHEKIEVLDFQINNNNVSESGAIASNQEIPCVSRKEIEDHDENVSKDKEDNDFEFKVLGVNEISDYSLKETLYADPEIASQKQENNMLAEQNPSEILSVDFNMVGTKVRDHGDDHGDDDDDDDGLNKKSKTNKSFDDIDITSIGFNKSNFNNVNNFATEEILTNNLSLKKENLTENIDIDILNNCNAKISNDDCFNSNELKTDFVDGSDDKFIATGDGNGEKIGESTDDNIVSMQNNETCDNYEISTVLPKDSIINVLSDKSETCNVSETNDKCGVHVFVVDVTDNNEDNTEGEQIREEGDSIDAKNVGENVFCSKSINAPDKTVEITRVLTSDSDQDFGRGGENTFEAENNEARKIDDMGRSPNVDVYKNATSEERTHENLTIFDNEKNEKNNLNEGNSSKPNHAIENTKVDNKDDLEKEIDAYFETNPNSCVIKEQNYENKDSSPCSSISLSDFDKYGIVENKNQGTHESTPSITTDVSKTNLTSENKNEEIAKVKIKTNYFDGKDIKKDEDDSSREGTSPLSPDEISSNVSRSVPTTSHSQFTADKIEISDIVNQNTSEKNKENDTKIIDEGGSSEKINPSSPFFGGFKKIIFDFFKNDKEQENTKDEKIQKTETISNNAEGLQSDQNEPPSSSQIESTLEDSTSTKKSTITFYDFHLNNKPYNCIPEYENEEEEEEDEVDGDVIDENSEEIGSDIRIIKTASSNSNEMIIQVFVKNDTLLKEMQKLADTTEEAKDDGEETKSNGGKRAHTSTATSSQSRNRNTSSGNHLGYNQDYGNDGDDDDDDERRRRNNNNRKLPSPSRSPVRKRKKKPVTKLQKTKEVYPAMDEIEENFDFLPQRLTIQVTPSIDDQIIATLHTVEDFYKMIGQSVVGAKATKKGSNWFVETPKVVLSDYDRDSQQMLQQKQQQLMELQQQQENLKDLMKSGMTEIDKVDLDEFLKKKQFSTSLNLTLDKGRDDKGLLSGSSVDAEDAEGRKRKQVTQQQFEGKWVPVYDVTDSKGMVVKLSGMKEAEWMTLMNSDGKFATVAGGRIFAKRRIDYNENTISPTEEEIEKFFEPKLPVVDQVSLTQSFKQRHKQLIHFLDKTEEATSAATDLIADVIHDHEREGTEFGYSDKSSKRDEEEEEEMEEDEDEVEGARLTDQIMLIFSSSDLAAGVFGGVDGNPANDDSWSNGNDFKRNQSINESQHEDYDKAPQKWNTVNSLSLGELDSGTEYTQEDDFKSISCAATTPPVTETNDRRWFSDEDPQNTVPSDEIIRRHRSIEDGFSDFDYRISNLTDRVQRLRDSDIGGSEKESTKGGRKSINSATGSEIDSRISEKPFERYTSPDPQNDFYREHEKYYRGIEDSKNNERIHSTDRRSTERDSISGNESSNARRKSSDLLGRNDYGRHKNYEFNSDYDGMAKGDDNDRDYRSGAETSTKDRHFHRYSDRQSTRSRYSDRHSEIDSDSQSERDRSRIRRSSRTLISRRTSNSSEKLQQPNTKFSTDINDYKTNLPRGSINVQSPERYIPSSNIFNDQVDSNRAPTTIPDASSSSYFKTSYNKDEFPKVTGKFKTTYPKDDDKIGEFSGSQYKDDNTLNRETRDTSLKTETSTYSRKDSGRSQARIPLTVINDTKTVTTHIIGTTSVQTSSTDTESFSYPRDTARIRDNPNVIVPNKPLEIGKKTEPSKRFSNLMDENTKNNNFSIDTRISTTIPEQTTPHFDATPSTASMKSNFEGVQTIKKPYVDTSASTGSTMSASSSNSFGFYKEVDRFSKRPSDTKDISSTSISSTVVDDHSEFMDRYETIDNSVSSRDDKPFSRAYKPSSNIDTNETGSSLYNNERARSSSRSSTMQDKSTKDNRTRNELEKQNLTKTKIYSDKDKEDENPYVTTFEYAEMISVIKAAKKSFNQSFDASRKVPKWVQGKPPLMISPPRWVWGGPFSQYKKNIFSVLPPNLNSFQIKHLAQQKNYTPISVAMVSDKFYIVATSNLMYSKPGTIAVSVVKRKKRRRRKKESDGSEGSSGSFRSGSGDSV